MRISVTGQTTTDGGESPPLDPPSPIPIWEMFELEFLRVSANDVKPFQEVTIEWSIKSLQPAVFPFADFVFTLIAGGNELSTDIADTGTIQFPSHGTTLIRMTVKRRGSGDSFSLGEGLVLRTDQSDCLPITIQANIVDALMDGVAQVATTTAELRMRRRFVPSPSGPGGDFVEMEVSPTWGLGVITYFFPLEVVLTPFFNANLDVTFKVRFRVHHVDDMTDLEVVITHESNIDFAAIEHIFSFGSAWAVTKTANRLIPLILACEVPNLERAFLSLIVEFVEANLKFKDPDFDLRTTHRLLDVRIDPTENSSHLMVVVCPRPAAPDEDDPVIVG